MIPVGLDRPLIRTPYVTLSLMALNALAYMIQRGGGNVTYAYSFSPKHPCLATLFTHMFLHAGVAHLVGNMFFFAVAGLKTEDALGPIRFLIFYLGCGVAANMTYTLLAGDEPRILLGASGAIAGVLGGFMVLYPFNHVRLLNLIPLFRWELPAWVFLGFWILREIYNLVMVQRFGVDSGVAVAAHVGGFIAGAVWAWAFCGWNAGEGLDEVAMDEVSAPVYVAADYESPGGGR